MKVKVTGTSVELQSFLQEFEDRIKEAELECILDTVEEIESSEEKITETTVTEQPTDTETNPSGTSSGTFSHSLYRVTDSGKFYTAYPKKQNYIYTCGMFYCTVEQALADWGKNGATKEKIEALVNIGSIRIDSINSVIYYNCRDLGLHFPGNEQWYWGAPNFDTNPGIVDFKFDEDQPKSNMVTDDGQPYEHVENKYSGYITINGELYGIAKEVAKKYGVSEGFVHSNGKIGRISKVKADRWRINLFSEDDEAVDRVYHYKCSDIERLCDKRLFTKSGKRIKRVEPGFIEIDGELYGTKSCLRNKYLLPETRFNKYLENRSMTIRSEKAIYAESNGHWVAYYNCADLEKCIDIDGFVSKYAPIKSSIPEVQEPVQPKKYTDSGLEYTVPHGKTEDHTIAVTGFGYYNWFGPVSVVSKELGIDQKKIIDASNVRLVYVDGKPYCNWADARDLVAEKKKQEEKKLEEKEIQQEKDRIDQLNSFGPLTESGKEFKYTMDKGIIEIDGEMYVNKHASSKVCNASESYLYTHQSEIANEKVKGFARFFKVSDIKKCKEAKKKDDSKSNIDKGENSDTYTNSGKKYNNLADGYINVESKTYGSAKVLANQYDISPNVIYTYKAVKTERIGRNVYFNCDDLEKHLEKVEQHKADMKAKREKGDQESPQFKVWREHIKDMCKPSGKDVSKILSVAYKKMTKKYGIVFEQLRKEFYQDNDRFPKSTLELVWWLQTIHNTECVKLLEGIIANMIEKKDYVV